jgi:hypothetical protein
VLIIAIVAITGVSIMGTEGQNQSMANGNERWMDLLKALEDKYKLLEYDVTLVYGSAESAEELKNPKPTGKFARAHVLFECRTQRSYIEHEQESAETTNRSIRRIAAFDGTTSTQLHFMGKGHQLGDYFPPKGYIGNSPLLDDDWIASIADYSLGLDIFPGFYGRGKGIVYAVQNADKAKIVEKSAGILEIHFFEEEHISQPRKPGGPLPHPEGGLVQTWKKVVLDMTRGGIITAIEKYNCWPNSNDPNEHTYWWLEVQYQKTNDGNWIPLSAIDLIGALSKKAVRKYEYKNVSYDHFDPESHIDRFRVKFPPGTKIRDTRTGESFRMGED